MKVLWAELTLSDTDIQTDHLGLLIQYFEPKGLFLFVYFEGWVPVDKFNKQYCWHASVVDYDTREALVLRPSDGDEAVLEIASVPLTELMEQTLELIGTNVNGNPYGQRHTARSSVTSSFIYLFKCNS